MNSDHYGIVKQTAEVFLLCVLGSGEAKRLKGPFFKDAIANKAACFIHE